MYHLTRQPPLTDGICDRCSGRLYQREDDRLESVVIRMATYERNTAPLIDFYQNLGLLESVAATGSPGEICARTVSALDARRHGRR